MENYSPSFFTWSMYTYIYIVGLLLLNPCLVNAQEQYVLIPEDSTALEDVLVERYYEANAADCADTSGGYLPKGSVIYRIFIDMKPGYALLTVYGTEGHPLFLKTTTTFYNFHKGGYAMTGFNVELKDMNRSNVLFDSWITMSAANRRYAGIPREDDKDGTSLINRKEFLNNDGLTMGNFPMFSHFNMDLDFFRERTDASFLKVDNGGWGALVQGGLGIMGPKSDNKVLIAQLTTDGLLSFQLNVQLRTPAGGTVKFTAKNPDTTEIQLNRLSYSQ